MSLAPSTPSIEVRSPVLGAASPAVVAPVPSGVARSASPSGCESVAWSGGSRAGWTRLTFVFADALGLAVVAGVLVGGAAVLNVGVPFALIAPLAVLLPVAFGIAGLYNAACVHPADELEQVGTMATLVCLAYAVPAAATHSGAGLPAMEAVAALVVTWALVVGVLPVVRAVGRVAFARFEWWGSRAVVLAQGGAAEPVVRTLRRWPELGLRPVGVLRDGEGGDHVGGVKVWGKSRKAPTIARKLSVRYAILAMPELTARQLSDLVRKYGSHFDRVIVVPALRGAPALWASGRRPEGLLGYGVTAPSCRGGRNAAKRVIDFGLAVLALTVLALPLLALAIAIKLDSPGPVLFRQTRLGTGGRCFTILKFRSMHADADARLEALLARDPARRAEYERFKKLRDDPRVTAIGRFIRKYSLDELPQLFNVVRGDLSLVGPRAYLPRELSSMGGLERSVLQCRPGVTGLWQVSGRNELPFAERLSMDAHYVQHWTPWLDLYILAKTIPVVLTGEGGR